MAGNVFLELDANSGALTLEGTTTTLFQLNAATGDVSSAVLPWHWQRAMGRSLRRMLRLTSVADRKTLDFVKLLLSCVDADGGADSSLSSAVSGDVVTVSLTAPAGSSVLLSIQRQGGSVKPVATPSAGGQVNLSAYALKTEIPVVSDVSVDRAYFVDKAGNDTTGNGSLSKPFLTIGKALQASSTVAAGNYVRVNVGPGEYTENVTISRARTILAGAGVDPEDRTTSILGSLTVDCGTASQRFNDVVAVQGVYVNNGAKVTGTGAFMVVFTDCYLTTGNAATNAVLVDNTNAQRPVIYLRNCTVTKQGLATTDVVKLSRGDVRMDTVRVYASDGGTGHGILLNNDASLWADRVQVDHNMSGSGIHVDVNYPSTALLLSNSSVKCLTPGLYLKNASSVAASLAAFLWQVLVHASSAGAGAAGIDGAVGAKLVYGQVTFGYGSNTTVSTGIVKLKMTDMA